MLALERIIDGQADACQLAQYERMLGERKDNAGPQHEDLWLLSTPDARSFSLQQAVHLRSSAAVPELARDDDGRIYLFFVEGSLERGEQLAREGSDWFRGHGLIGFGALDLLVSSDQGQTFTAVPEFEVRGLVRGMVVDPELLRLPDGRWRLYYLGVPVPALLAPDAWVDGSPHKVWYAESDDLVHWEQVGLAVDGPNADPTVHCSDRDRCVMISTGLDRSFSVDGGQSFQFRGHWGLPGFAPELVELPDGALRLLYNRKEQGGPLHATRSEDGGVSWTEQGQLIPPFKAEAISITAATQGGFLAAYHYWQPGYSGDSWVDGYEKRDDDKLPERRLPLQ